NAAIRVWCFSPLHLLNLELGASQAMIRCYLPAGRRRRGVRHSSRLGLVKRCRIPLTTGNGQSDGRGETKRIRDYREREAVTESRTRAPGRGKLRMAPEIVVTAGDVIAFRAAPGNAHLIYDGATVRVVPQLSAERDYPAAFVITTREDLPEVDPD